MNQFRLAQQSTLLVGPEPSVYFLANFVRHAPATQAGPAGYAGYALRAAHRPTPLSPFRFAPPSRHSAPPPGVAAGPAGQGGGVPRGCAARPGARGQVHLLAVSGRRTPRGRHRLTDPSFRGHFRFHPQRTHYFGSGSSGLGVGTRSGRVAPDPGCRAPLRGRAAQCGARVTVPDLTDLTPVARSGGSEGRGTEPTISCDTDEAPPAPPPSSLDPLGWASQAGALVPGGFELGFMLSL